MSHIAKQKGTVILLFGLILVVAGCSTQNSKSSVDPDTGKHYIAGWSNPATHGAWAEQSSSDGGFASCQECHGDDFSGGISKTACSSCHGGSAPHPTAWLTHSATDQSNAPVCAVCHTGGNNLTSFPTPTPPPAGTPPGCFNNTLCHDQNPGHAPGWADPAAHGAAAKSRTNGFSGCQVCHGTDFKGAVSGTAPSCLENSLCHGPTTTSPHPQAPWRTSAGSARTHTDTNEGNSTVCAICHTGGANLVTVPTPTNLVAGPPYTCFNNTLCHGRYGCVDCHSSIVSAPTASLVSGGTVTQRDAVVGEFGLAWGHKKAGRGAVTDADCIVCHLEGNSGTLTTSAKHRDGYIDLRDPDGSGETEITDMGGVTPFRFVQFLTSYTTGSRTSTGHLSNDIDNVLTQKFCLACHDSNGATNTTAWTTGGTAVMPFGGVNLGANYTVANGAAAAGGLVDVKTQLATTNRSWHPVLGPKNRDFPTAARMNDPYKPTGTRGTQGTLSQGVVLNCFDCHNVSGAPLTTRTAAAHGNAETIRGVATVSGTPAATTNDVTFCKVCHAGYVTGSSSHGAGSALSGGTDGGMTVYLNYGCNICHSSGYTTAVPRPIRAQDTHGSNTLGTVGTLLTTQGRWSTDPTPIAFIRNRQVLPQHQPKKIGTTTYTNPVCMGGNTSPCSQGQQTYSVGGTY